MNLLRYNLQCARNSLQMAVFFTLALMFLSVTASIAQTTCTANAGTLNATEICLLNDQTILRATSKGDTVVPQGFRVRYVLTSGTDLVIRQVSERPVFILPDSATGLYTLHTLVFNPSTLDLSTVRIGVTTGFDVNALLVQGGGSICASLDVTGVKVRFGNCEDICQAKAGRLVPANRDCLSNGTATLTANRLTPSVIPSGYTRLYVLTRTDSLIIEQVNATPTFNVTRTGKFRIHTLVYNPATLNLGIVQFGVTTGFNVNALLIQGGGTICASLDVDGAVFQVSTCPQVCEAKAGKLVPANRDCLRDGTATLTANRLTPSVIPSGYTRLYVLTRTDSLIIEQVNANPTFNVTRTGKFRIHTLVYNPATLNLGIVQFGVTTGFNVNALLIQGGGTICASLDVDGAVFQVSTCPQVCEAKAGKLVPANRDCLRDGTATLTANRLTPSVIPSGYTRLYVLTRTDSLIIEQVNANPTFNVTRTGKFRIHTLVYNPATLNLGIVQFGVTTGFNVNALLIQGGGTICASLDVDGAVFQVSTCPQVCEAKAGRLVPANHDCLRDGTATLTANRLTPSVIPSGYTRLYVLTRTDSLIIEQVNANPTFNVTRTGKFRIHTLVYNPATLNLGIVQFGVTTGFNVNALLIQGGGTICASLDVDGAVFQVSTCPQTQVCQANAGRLRIAQAACLRNSRAILQARVLENPTVPQGFRIAYVLTSGSNLLIERINTASPIFEVNRTGRFTIHTLVYDPTTLHITDIRRGTTGADIVNLFIQGGGRLCGALDVTGAPFDVQNCGSHLTGSIKTFPNPATSIVNVQFEELENVKRITVELLDATGNLVNTWHFDGQTQQTALDIATLNTGTYNLRILYDDQFSETIRVVKASY